MAQEKTGVQVKISTTLKKRDVNTGEILEVIEREHTVPLSDLTGESDGDHNSGNDGNS